METINIIISTILKNKPVLIKKYPIKQIGIFGSIARGDFNEDSDVDILVEFNQPIGIEFIDLANELESILQQKVDLVSRSGIKPKYFKMIEKDLIYVWSFNWIINRRYFWIMQPDSGIHKGFILWRF